jgi:hypothetical protein
MPRLKRPQPEPEPEPIAGTDAQIPWALGDLLRDGPSPLVQRPARSLLRATLLLGPGIETPRAAGLPPELLNALRSESIQLRTVTAAELEAFEEEPDPTDAHPLASADVVLAAGWAAAPAVLTAPGLRARAVLATPDPPPLEHLGWATGIPVLGTAWLGGDLPPGADAAYGPRPVHRRDDLVLVHGEEPFGLLAAAELARRRDDLTFAVTGVRPDLALPFPFIGAEPGPEALAHAFASATAALAPSVRGWRPAATAMLACGQAVVAPDDVPTRAALQDAASFARGPIEAADAVERLLADPDYVLRAERARAGFALVPGGWGATAAALASALRSF